VGNRGKTQPQAVGRIQGPSRRLVATGIALLALTACLPVAGAQAQPSDTTVFTDDFESGSFAPNWSVTRLANGLAEVQAGIGTNGSKAARLTVPDYTSNSIAYIKHTLATPALGLSASGNFKVNSGGCSDTAGYSAGNVPFLRFFDADGRRVAGLYRINGSCSRTAKLYVQHSGNYYRTGKNISFGQVYSAELRILVAEPSKSLVQVYLDGVLVYETTIADNGLKPIASVTIHNEHTNQVGDLVADDIKLATFGSTQPPPTNPCEPTTPAPVSTDPGTTILADNFESFGFGQWTTQRSGDGTATVQTAVVHTGSCAALLTVSTNTGSKANIAKTTPAGTGSVWADGWFNVQAGGVNTASNIPLLRLFSGTTRVVSLYRVNGNGALYLALPNGSGGWVYTNLGRTIALNTWYRLKLITDANGNASTVQVVFNGAATPLFTTASAPLGTTTINTVQIGNELATQDGKLAVDDVVINAAP
jgi:hypothetical protein